MKKNPTPLPSLSQETFLVDSHCHLDMDAYKDDLDEVLEQAYRNHVRWIISIGIDVESSRRAISLAQKYAMIKATIGIHPHDVSHIQDETLDILAELAAENGHHVVGYGEIGLDYVKNYSPPALQRRHFRSQLALAKELGLPVIVHDRDAHEDTLRLLREAAPFDHGGVMHCFSGDLTLARQVMELGFHISIPGVVTFKNATDLQEVARLTPLTSLLVETDGPFLSPAPWRGKRNEPAFLVHTAQFIADLRDIPINEVARQTSANAMALFQLPATLMT